ncbi:MAG: sulfite exporter TauE/SafE family protein [candidate division Zixibacteria bacterium]|nr:sulfite exporter TauE/SafE family protein [candidate division Zixibacteria bacterium]
MSRELSILTITAASIGFLHTLFGPDHYLPFIVMSKARKWSLFKTSWITFLCGVGHIGSSVLLGMIGVALGVAVSKLEVVESVRGGIAAWALIIFGLVYSIWGLRKALRNRPHEHGHTHMNGTVHAHGHAHTEEHMHAHQEEGSVNLTPWILFTIFVLGPCEPLIPILMYPAAKNNLGGVILVSGIFGGITITTMLGIVLVSTFGISLFPMKRLERYTHALAGATICLCGVAIKFLGL